MNNNYTHQNSRAFSRDEERASIHLEKELSSFIDEPTAEKPRRHRLNPARKEPLSDRNSGFLKDTTN